jgi:hypothetical protein
MFNRRKLFFAATITAAGFNVPLPADAIERPIGLAAPTAPQGASGGWPINSPEDSVRLSGAGGIEVEDFINKTELFCVVGTKDGGVWSGTIKRSDRSAGMRVRSETIFRAISMSSFRR